MRVPNDSMRSLSALVLLFTMYVPAPARAEPASGEQGSAQLAKAAEAFDRGKAAYKAQQFAEAAEQFELADQQAPSAAALELAIRARDKAESLDQAATLAALAVERYPDDAVIGKVAHDVLERAATDLVELKISCSEPCELKIADKPIYGVAASSRRVFVVPGSFALRADFSADRSTSKQIKATKAGASKSLSLAPVAPEAAEAEPETTPADKSAALPIAAEPEVKAEPRPHAAGSGLSPVFFWSGVALTGALGVASAWSGFDTQNTPGRDAVRDACAAGRPQCATLYNQGVDRQNRTNILLGVTAGVGVATGIVGAFFTNFSSREAHATVLTRRLVRAPRLQVEPWSVPGTLASVGALGRF